MVKVKLLAVVPALAAALALAGIAAADPPPLYVTFRPDHSFFVYLPNGTQVGTTNGGGSVIAAGSYTLLLDDTAAVDMPFDLAGPGVKLVTDMAHAEEVSDAVVVTFQPNSTYTYRDDNHPNVFWTFTTSSQVLPPSPTTTTTCSTCTTPGGTAGTGDIVGSQSITPRGSLAGAVSACGPPDVDCKGQDGWHARGRELQAHHRRSELEQGLHPATRPQGRPAGDGSLVRRHAPPHDRPHGRAVGVLLAGRR